MNWTSSFSGYFVGAGVETRLALGVFRDALPTAGVRPVVPFCKTGSEKRALLSGLFLEGVAAWSGFAGDVMDLDLFERRTVTVSEELFVTMVGDGRRMTGRQVQMQAQTSNETKWRSK